MRRADGCVGSVTGEGSPRKKQDIEVFEIASEGMRRKPMRPEE